MNSKTEDDRAKRFGTRPIGRIIVIVVLALFVWVSVLVLRYMFAKQDVVVSVSPDGSRQVVVRQPRFVFIDRNFDVLLVDRRTREQQVIFESWDQSPMIEEERFVWSSNSQNVALVGDSYFVIPGSKLPNGLSVFLVYDVGDGTLYCNTDQPRSFPRISAEQALDLFGDRILTADGT